MLIVLAGSARVRVFEQRSGQIKDYAIGMSPLTTQDPGEREHLPPSGATYLPVGCCFSELALHKSNQTC